ncbi:MAG TPA: type II secretion system protein [Vicinamibacterales bacterium]|nr:type II secretion system protein [Vicinamibacterales bacterium]
MRAREDHGFTLIELLIVVAIIAILTALATAGLMRSRVAANETSAIAGIRVTSSSQKAYAVSCGFGAYATSYTVLGTAVGGTSSYISSDLGGALSPIKSGFQFNLTAGAGATAGPPDCIGRPTITAFYATAVPLSVWSGSRSFAINGNGVVWQLNGATAPTEPFGAPARPIQ